jgi:hypothetical protein
MNAVQVGFLLSGILGIDGKPLASGKVYSYAGGTTIPKTLYTAADKTANAANPVILDASGKANVYADGLYKFVVKDAAGVTLYTWDNLYYVFPSATATDIVSITYANSPYTASNVAQLIKTNSASGAVTVNLPTAIGNGGLTIQVLKTSSDANAVTLDGYGTETINGAYTFAISSQYETVQIVSDNANWAVVNSNTSGSVTLTGTQTLTNKTLTAPVLGGTVTGIYTLGGTPTINSPVIATATINNSTINSPTITSPTITTLVDAYTYDYVDFTGSSTIDGFSSTTGSFIRYRRVGKLVWMWVDITGTSNSAVASFTLPFYVRDGLTGQMVIPCRVIDNGVAGTAPGMIVMNNGGVSAVAYKDFSGTGWTASGAKRIQVTFVYLSQ